MVEKYIRIRCTKHYSFDEIITKAWNETIGDNIKELKFISFSINDDGSAIFVFEKEWY